jgi:hypothetical protein
MANTKISALTSGNPAQSGDILPIDRAGANFGITAGSIAALVNVPVVPVISTAGQGFFIGPGLIGGNVANSTAAALSSATNNQVNAVQFVLHEAWTIRHVTYAAAAAGAVGAKFAIGIYSATGTTKLLEAQFDATSTTAQSVTVNVVLPPGVYWYAWASNDTTATGYVVPNFGTSTGKVWTSYINNVVVKMGKSPNAMSAGVLPPSLGTMVADGGITAPGQNVPAAVFEP